MNNPYNAPTADLSALKEGSATYQPKVFAMDGRIGRLRYLAYAMCVGMLVTFAALLVAGVIIAMIKPGETGVMLVIGIAYIPPVVISFVMAIRRLNDMNKSGWLSLLSLVPLVNLGFALWLLFGRGDESTNQYGPPPCANSNGVVAACFAPIILVALFGILAAIAIPVYQDYVNKAKAAQEEATAPPAVEQAPE